MDGDRAAETKVEWVTIEERGPDGRPMMPRQAIRSTEATKYDSNRHTDLGLRILVGMAPQGAIVGQYKLYDVTRFAMAGWRTRAQAIVELAPTRGYEERWFEAFRESEVIVEDPGVAGEISEQYIMKVEQSTFTKKEISSVNEKTGAVLREQLFEGRLWMRETIRSTVARRRGELVRYVGLTTIAALIGLALGKVL